jgi:hypothetical protein
MKINRYKIKNLAFPDYPVPGSFVFSEDGSNEIMGFVKEYDENTELIDICLFEEKDISDFMDKAYHIKMLDKSYDSKIMEYFEDITKNNENIRQMWIEVFQNS